MNWEFIGKLTTIGSLITFFVFIFFLSTVKGATSEVNEFKGKCKRVSDFVFRCDYGDVECFCSGNGISCLRKGE